MLTINSENAKQIRTPFEIHCSLVSREDNTLSTGIGTGSQIALRDTNYQQSLGNDGYAMRTLTDLANGGFRADGSASFYDENATASSSTGKLGLRTSVGGSAVLNISASKTINSLTVEVFEGTGTITHGRTVYPINGLMVIPIGSRNAQLTIQADEGSRVSIASIVAGLILQFDRENIVSCELALRSNLDIIDPSWEVSDIEIKAYYPYDIASAISNVGDNTPITYYAGYEGDYSKTRTFYLCERASMENNVLTLKGEDASTRLDDTTMPVVAIISRANNSMNTLYSRMVNAVQSALGNVPINIEAVPPTYGLDTTQSVLVWTEQTARNIVANIMNVGHIEVGGDGFYPTFVDAGIPTLRWSRPTPKWDIYEEDCAEVVNEYDRNYSKLESSNDVYGLHTYVSISPSNTLIESVDVTDGNIEEYNFEGFVYQPSVSNARSVITANPSRIVWIAGGYEQSDVYGYRMSVENIARELTTDRLGSSAKIDPNVYGRMYHKNSSQLLFPDYSKLFNISNLTGSFTWKGDPRIQPRDVFTFHRLDGTEEVCTIETISISHSGGGTTSQITYRKGVV